MFSPDIVNSDAFLEMPASTQALYFQLGMKADDDGFVNPKMVMRMMGSSEDELKVLFAKRFVLPFSNGVIVIKHWKVNNLVRKDWYKPTVYFEEKTSLYLKENGSYTTDSSQGLKLVNEPLTQVRLGKDRLLSETKVSPEFVIREESEKSSLKSKVKYPHALEVFSWFAHPQPSWRLNVTELKHAELLYNRKESQVRGALKFVNDHKDSDFFPKVTKPSDLERKWSDLFAFKEKNGL